MFSLSLTFTSINLLKISEIQNLLTLEWKRPHRELRTGGSTLEPLYKASAYCNFVMLTLGPDIQS